jgi:uncharacterized protein YbjT (DUF2867 family)
MRILVIGGTGRVGSAAARALTGSEHDILVMTRDPQKALHLPDGQRGVVGDLADRASLAGPLEDVEAVFMVTPLDENEASLGLNAVAAAADAGVGRFVYISVHQADAYPGIPHFASKVRVENALADSVMAFAILRPNSFYQNDLALLPVIRDHGVYPHPLGSKGVNSVHIEDIGAAAARALTDSTFDGRTLAMVGPEVQTGEGNAAIWSRLLGRPVAYVGDLDAWEAQLRNFLTPRLAADVRGMYEEFQKHGLRASDADLADTRALLGREGRRYEEWVVATVEGEVKKP